MPGPIVRRRSCARRVRCERTAFGPVTARRSALISRQPPHRDGQYLERRTHLEARRHVARQRLWRQGRGGGRRARPGRVRRWLRPESTASPSVGSPGRTTRKSRDEGSSDMNRPRHPAPRLSTLMSRGWRPVEPPRRPVLFVNPRSGDGAATRNRVVERARERGVEAVTLGPGDDLRTRVLEVVADGADALGMAGGDGSLADVAAVAAAHGLPFVCIPVGTRNHFALDLGVDRQDVPGALDAFTDGVERLIDVGEVNGRIFLNNVSLGIYGEAVRQASYRDTKVRTLAETARRVLGPSRRTAGATPCRRHRTRACTACCAACLQQPVCVERPWSWHSTDARQRSAGDPGARHTR